MFPISKYDFYTTKANETIAVSTYAGRTVRGKAKVDPRDRFDPEFGKELAAARCNAKIAYKRKQRAHNKVTEAWKEYDKALTHLQKMEKYEKESFQAYELATYKVAELESKS